jgi:putative DNA primase/helicase
MYASRGHPVFPIVPGGKAPLSELAPHGLKDATVDPDTIKAWWCERPDASIGMRCDRLLVLDIDPGGDEALDALMNKHGPLPPTREQATPRGGRHVLLRVPADAELGNSTRGIGSPEGLDVRAGVKGYIVVSPSRNGSGGYRWTNSLPIADAPGWLMDALARPERERSQLPPGRASGEHSRYGAVALAAEVASVRGAPEGQRNTQLNDSAFACGQLEAGGELVPGDAEALLIGAAIDAGLPQSEARRTVRSGLEAGRGSPRSAPSVSGRDGQPGGRAGSEPSLDDALRDPALYREFIERFVDGPPQPTPKGASEPPSPEGGSVGRYELIASNDGGTAVPGDGANMAVSGSEELRLTDLENARTFVRLHGHRFRHVLDRHRWLYWDEIVWREDATGEGSRAAKETIDTQLRAALEISDQKRRERAVREALRAQSEPRIRGLLTLAATEAGIALAPEQLDRRPYLLTCANGTLDLRSGALRAPDPADLITISTDVPYQAAATCSRWIDFTKQIFDGDDDLIAYFHRLIGYFLTGDTREHVLSVWQGPGANGKSTAQKTVRRVVGRHAVTAAFDTFTRIRGDRGPRNDLARLHRARIVFASESGEGRRLDEATVKNITGGDAVSARFLYGEHFEFEPMFKLVLVTNHLPRVDGDDDAIWRRLQRLLFEVSFQGREDRELDQRLEAELPGILKWALEGCLEWQAEGLNPPQRVIAATADYRRGEDVLGAFLEERCHLDHGGSVTVPDLRDAYEGYCKQIGEHPLAANVLGKRLAKRGIKSEVRSGTRTYIGITTR